jgi:hypothetical protein
MKHPEKILFLGLFLLFIIALAITVIACSNKKRGILREWSQVSTDVVVFENMLDYTQLKQYIDPNSTSDPILISTVGTIVFDPSTTNDAKVDSLKAASFRDKFVNNTINSTNFTDQTIVSMIQTYLLSLKVGTETNNKTG